MCTLPPGLHVRESALGAKLTRSANCCSVGLVRAMISEVGMYSDGRTTAEFEALGLDCDANDGTSTPAPVPDDPQAGEDIEQMTEYVVAESTFAPQADCSEAADGEELCECHLDYGISVVSAADCTPPRLTHALWAGLLRAMIAEVQTYAPGETSSEFQALGLECNDDGHQTVQEPVAEPSVAHEDPSTSEHQAQPAAEPGANSDEEPAAEPQPQPAAETDAILSGEPAPDEEPPPEEEPATGPDANLNAEPASEPAQPVAEPDADAYDEPGSEPESQPAAEPDADAYEEPASEPAQPAAEPDADAYEEPASEPESQPAAEPDADADEEPTSEHESQPAAEPDLDRDCEMGYWRSSPEASCIAWTSCNDGLVVTVTGSTTQDQICGVKLVGTTVVSEAVDARKFESQLAIASGVAEAVTILITSFEQIVSCVVRVPGTVSSWNVPAAKAQFRTGIANALGVQSSLVSELIIADARGRRLQDELVAISYDVVLRDPTTAATVAAVVKDTSAFSQALAHAINEAGGGLSLDGSDVTVEPPAISTTIEYDIIIATADTTVVSSVEEQLQDTAVMATALSAATGTSIAADEVVATVAHAPTTIPITSQSQDGTLAEKDLLENEVQQLPFAAIAGGGGVVVLVVWICVLLKCRKKKVAPVPNDFVAKYVPGTSDDKHGYEQADAQQQQLKAELDQLQREHEQQRFEQLEAMEDARDKLAQLQKEKWNELLSADGSSAGLMSEMDQERATVEGRMAVVQSEAKKKLRQKLEERQREQATKLLDEL